MSLSGSNKECFSEVQSELQGVLVSVKIQDTEKATNEKRVRFNNLVEVRFIPKLKSKKNKEERDKKKPEDKVSGEGEGKENTDVGNLNENRNETADPKVDSLDKKKVKDKKVVKTISENLDTGDNVAEKEEFYLPKVTIGQEYEGDVTRTAKVASKPQPRNAIRLLKRTSKEPKIQDLNVKAVVQLERQATEYCKEADRLFEETINSKGKIDETASSLRYENANESNRSSPQDQQLPNSNLKRCQSVSEIHRRMSLEMKSSERQGIMNESSPKKISTSLPYINMIPSLTGKHLETNQKDSYTKLYLPQLHRKAEDIIRLNDTVLRKKPKYSPDRSPSSPNESTSPLGFTADRSGDKVISSPLASSHSIVRYSHGLDIARLLKLTNSTQLFY